LRNEGDHGQLCRARPSSPRQARLLTRLFPSPAIRGSSIAVLVVPVVIRVVVFIGRLVTLVTKLHDSFDLLTRGCVAEQLLLALSNLG
jgi:hypothetical protein